MGQYGFDPDDHTEKQTDAEVFKEARLDRSGLSKTQWPAQIDRAALDLQYGMAIGASNEMGDIGGRIGDFNFNYATGEHYVERLKTIAGSDSSVADVLGKYDANRIGQLTYRLNEFRHQLRTEADSLDIDRALEAVVEKQATTAIDISHKSDRGAGAGLRQLNDTDSTADIILKLFSDAQIDQYAQALLEELTNKQEDQALLELLDKPIMTTPLWDHQYRALAEWIEEGEKGYVDMATATGKTVLGLAALAYRHGQLHPADLNREQRTLEKSQPQREESSGTPRVLVVAGNTLLLQQWRAEFDEHLDIPKSRTEPVESEDEGSAVIELSSVVIEFRTAQELVAQELLSTYDLVILDEAHRYTRGSNSSRGWGALFEDITTNSEAVLAMSGSVDGGWAGDDGAREALETHLTQCMKFSVAKARDQGVIADFSWTVHYAPVNTADVEKLAEETKVTRRNYDATTGSLDTDALDIPPDEVPAPFTSYGDIRSFVQSKTGSELREQSEQFDLFSSALFARRPVRWNMSPTLHSIAELVTDHAPETSTVVLVQSYEEARKLEGMLVEETSLSSDVIVRLEDSANRFAKIETFNEMAGGVIIGPGNLLGVGVDMPDAEVAINVARGGVNASLVQRIGRVLRDPTGEKTAEFYHIVPQPTRNDALHTAEDGTKLLQRAAEYRRLGETFKQLPVYEASTPTIESTIVELEDQSVHVLDRLDDLSSLVDEEETRKNIRRIQGHIQGAKADSQAHRDESILLNRWSAEAESTETDTTADHFAERNDAYEEYRLALGPYRAGKRVATYLYDSTAEEEETDDGWIIHLDEELEGTQFHNELQRWLNKYKHWYTHCRRTEDEEGEPGTLIDYKQEWPTPPEDEGVLLPAEVAAEIGIDYAESDPIFFPRTDTGVYRFPLPDERHLTIQGIRDPGADGHDDSDSGQPSTTVEPTTPTGGGQTHQNGAPTGDDLDDGTAVYQINVALLEAVAQAVDDDDDMMAEIVDSLKQMLHGWIDDESLPTHDLDEMPTEPVALDIDEKLERMLQVVVSDTETPHDTESEVIEAALYATTDVDPTGDTKFEISVDNPTALAIERIIDSSDVYESVEQLLENKLRQQLEQG